MARLPQVTRRNVTTQAARSGLSAADIAAPYRTLAEAGAAIADVAGEWQDTVEKGRLAEEHNVIDKGIGELGRTFADDPDGFDTALQAFKAERIGKQGTARLQDAVGTYIDRLGTREGERLRDGQFRRSIELSNNSLNARKEIAFDRASSLAREGMIDSDEYRDAVGEYSAINDALVASPLSTYAPDQAAADTKRATDLLSVEAAIGGLDRAWDSTPGSADVRFAKLSADAETMLDAIGFDAADRRKYGAQVRSFLKAKASDAKIAQADMREQARGIIDDLRADPSAADAPDLDGFVGTLRAAGLHSEARRVEKARWSARADGFELLSPEERRAIRSAPVPRGTDAASLIRQFEGFRETPYWDVNAFRTGFGSDTITREDGTVVRVSAGMQVNREDAERDLTRRIGEFQSGIIATVGEEAWAALPENVKGPLTSVAYNYGSLPNRVAQAVATGDRENIAKAVESLRGHNGGVNAARRDMEAAIIRGSGGGPPVKYPGPMVKAFRKDATKGLRAAYTDFQDQIKAGITPDAGTLASMADDMRLADDRDLVAEVERSIKAAGVVLPQTAPGVPVTEQRAGLAEAEAGLLDGADAAEWEMFELRQANVEANERRLKDDPLYFWDRTRGPDQTAARLGALDPSNPDAFRAELEKRGTAAPFVESLQGITGVSAFRPGEAEQFKAAWAAGSVEDKVRLLNDLSVLPPETLKATVAAFADKDDTAALAWAAGLSTTNPAAAQAVVRGQGVLAEDKAFAWNLQKSGVRESIAESMPALGPGMARAGSAIEQAVKARYADLSFNANDKSGEFNQERFDQALGEVTGGVVEFNGQRVVAPRYGMSQADFDARMAGLAPSDLLGAATAKGDPVTPDIVRRDGRLVSVGEGRYLVQFGEDAATWFLTNRFGGAAFVLDLRDRQ